MKQIPAAATSGALAGAIMSMAMMLSMVITGRSMWTLPNLIAAMWMGVEVASEAPSAATLAGFLTHMATSVIMGLIAIPFIRDLSPRRTYLAALSYALASYPIVFAAVLSWANPLMVERAGLISMTAGHALFGVVMAATYLRLTPSEPRAP